jgi:hypothetical protein
VCIGVCMIAGEGAFYGIGERGGSEGRIEYIWHTTTYVGRHVSCLEELNEAYTSYSWV